MNVRKTIVIECAKFNYLENSLMNPLNAQRILIPAPIKKTSKFLFYKLRHSRTQVIIFKINNSKKIPELKPLKCI